MEENFVFSDYEEMPEKNKKRAERRKKDFSKAMRKKNLDKSIRPNWQPWYSNLHEYSKNKIHCSCPLCRFKNWYSGKDRKTTSDMKRLESAEEQIREYKAG